MPAPPPARICPMPLAQLRQSKANFPIQLCSWKKNVTRTKQQHQQHKKWEHQSVHDLLPQSFTEISLIRSFERQIVQEVKAQFDIRPAERRWQRLKRVRRPDRRHRRAVQRLLPGAKQSVRLPSRHTAIAHDAEL